MSAEKTDFLRFSAYSFKDMITRKMSENSKFTDQVYEGSNLAILIDLCSYLFQGMTYCLNNAASESMFSDTQIYENISRLVKMIGYNPKGFIPSSCEFQFDSGEYDDVMIPRYTCVNTGKTDPRGNDIYYSFVEDFTLGRSSQTDKNKVILYNGRWKMYNTIFTASGSKYETFVLDGLYSDSEKNNFVAYGYINVYVKRNDKFIQFKGTVDEIFMNSQNKYSSEEVINIYNNTDEDRYFSIRLNENKQYEIKFGNDNNGQTLLAEDKVYVFYLESNGFDATLQTGEVSKLKLLQPSTILGVTEEMFYQNMLGIADKGTYQEIMSAIDSIQDVMNTSTSTQAQQEEDVETIRQTAPDYYKLGNRLVSKQDFEYYVKNKFKENIIDVICHNNWDYISKFYGWLYKLGKDGIRTSFDTQSNRTRAINPQYYINSSRLVKYDYYYADPADQNNVYLWSKMQNSLDVWKQQLDNSLYPLKILTSEVIFLDPINVNFTICAAPIQRALHYIDDEQSFDPLNESYLEITINDNALYSNASIKSQVNSIFNQYFKVTSCKLGQNISSNELENQIYNINGVQNIRTVFSSEVVDEQGNKVYQDRFINGISFASWSSSLIDIGDDLEVSTMNKKLEDFQFPVLYNTDMTNQIKIIKKSFSNNSTIQY